MAKRRYAVDRLKIISEEMAGLPKLLKISIYMGAIAILLAGVSIYFQLQSMRLLHRAETKHRTFINRITNAKLLGDAWQLGDRKRSVDGAEVDASEQKQCRHRQKTEWVYFDGDSVDSEGTITVDFTGSEVSIYLIILEEKHQVFFGNVIKRIISNKVP